MANMNSPFGEGYLTAEQKQHQARVWVAQSPNANEVRNEILRIVSQAPIHTACLGELGERFGIPKPVSSVVRELCGNDVSFYSAKNSPTGCPALALTERASEDRYWLKFRRKGLDETSEVVDESPWDTLGIVVKTQFKTDEKPFNRFFMNRARIFAAFVEMKYGQGVIKGMAAICLEFKKASGVSFSAFFDGVRPSEFMNSEEARMLFNWSWTTATPPCLNCEVKRHFSPPPREVKFIPPPEVVDALLPFAQKTHPEGADFFRLAGSFPGLTEEEVMVCYLHALKKALQLKVSGGNVKKRSAETDEAVKQLLDVSRELASAANRIAAIAERLLNASEK